MLYENFLKIYALKLPTDLTKSTDLTDLQNIILTPKILSSENPVKVFYTVESPLKNAKHQAYLLRCLKDVFEKEKKKNISFLSFMITVFGSENAPFENIEACNILTHIFYFNIKEQVNALAFAEIGGDDDFIENSRIAEFIASPRVFAAYLRSLKQSKLSDKAILSTHLLHKYFSYWASGLHQTTNNPYDQLYKLLKYFPETKSLAKKAQKVLNNERRIGSHGENVSIFPNYALTGKKAPPHVRLKSIPKNILRVCFTPTLNNLKGLFLIFEKDFLLAAMKQWSVLATVSGSEVFYGFVRQLLNREDVVESQLPLILSNVYQSPHMLEVLAEILEETTLIDLAKRSGNILCLAKYRTELVTFVLEQNLTSYLDIICNSACEKLPLMISLIDLLSAINLTRPEFSVIIFNRLLDEMLQATYVFEDALVRKLISVPLYKKVIPERITAIQANLEAIILSEMSKLDSAMNYGRIEDCWWEGLKYINALLGISYKFTADYPMNKVQLHNRLAQVFQLRNFSYFDVTAFAKFLKIPQIFSPTSEVSAYERLLIELLGVIDNKNFRDECCMILDSNEEKINKIFTIGQIGLADPDLIKIDDKIFLGHQNFAERTMLGDGKTLGYGKMLAGEYVPLVGTYVLAVNRENFSSGYIQLAPSYTRLDEQEKCISLSESYPNQAPNKRSWRTFCYGDQDHFQRATYYRQLNILKWLKEENFVIVSAGACAILAAENLYWEIVAFFVQSYSLQLGIKKRLTHMASANGASNIIEILKPKSSYVQKENISIAIQNNDAVTLRSILKAINFRQSKKSNFDRFLGKSLTKAIELQHYAAAIAVGKCYKGKHLTAATYMAFEQLLNLQQYRRFNRLSPIWHSEWIQSVFLKAVSRNEQQLVACLLNGGYTLKLTILEKAINSAKKRKYPELRALLIKKHEDYLAIEQISERSTQEKKSSLKPSFSTNDLFGKDIHCGFGIFSSGRKGAEGILELRLPESVSP